MYRIFVQDPIKIVSGVDIPADIPMNIGRAEQDGIFLGEFVEFRDLQFQKRLNNYGTCQFSVPNKHSLLSLIKLRRNTVWVYKRVEDVDTLVWAGEMALAKGALTDNGNNWITIHCFDWFEQLRQKYTPAQIRYDQLPAGEIAWQLIDGSFKIQKGTIEDTQLRDREYFNQNVAQAIVNLSNVINGIDFEITNDRVFNTYNVKGVDRTQDIQFIYGHNVRAAQIEQNFLTPINKAIVIAEAEGASELVRIERTDTTSIAEYGVREGLSSEMEVTIISTLEDKGDAMLRKYANELLILDFEPVGNTHSIEGFEVGDIIYVEVKDGVYNIATDYRVFEWVVQFDNKGVEHLSLTLGRFTL
jgi:hypothetical protein